MGKPTQLSLFTQAPPVADPTLNPESPTTDSTHLGELFARVFRRLDLRRPQPQFSVAFFPYAGLRSTIALQKAGVEVSVSDVLEGAPALVLEALAEILVSRLFRRRPSREARDCYKAFVMRPEIRRRIDETRRQRGFKMLLPAQGRAFDLQAIFDQLNSRHFEGRLRVAAIGWSPAASRSNLGHYDPAHDSITISRLFDSPTVPRYLVEYLVFHEMLHIEHPIGRNGHRRVVHSREFLEAERAFPQYERARRRLKRMTGQALEPAL